MAGILLAQTGGDARAVVVEGLADEAASPALVGVLADLGAPEVVEDLKRLTVSGSPEVANAASEALEELDLP